MRGRLRFTLFLLVLPVLPFVFKAITHTHFSAASSPASSDVQLSPQTTAIRTELLVTLDLLVRAERTLRRESASFTRSLGRVPDVLGALPQYYRIEIAQADRNSLLVAAVGEKGRGRVIDSTIPGIAGIAGDRVAIDDRFHVVANFTLPHPPRDYLHTLSRVVMNRIFANAFDIPDRAQLDLWEGVFRRYFDYEIRPVSQGGRTLVAVGRRGPVKGDIVEMQPGANLFEWVYNHRHTGWIDYEVAGRLEKIFLAQRIYQDHIGSYSPTFKGVLSHWNDLAALSSDSSPIAVQEFQEDPTFGFHAELAQHASVLSNTSLSGGNAAATGGSRGPSSTTPRAWSVNGYGQVSELSSVENILSQFEQAQRKIAGHGAVDIVRVPSPVNDEAGFDISMPEKPTRLNDDVGRQPVSAPKGKGSPLLIDPVDP